jgi:hypothetical protein
MNHTTITPHIPKCYRCGALLHSLHSNQRDCLIGLSNQHLVVSLCFDCQDIDKELRADLKRSSSHRYIKEKSDRKCENVVSHIFLPTLHSESLYSTFQTNLSTMFNSNITKFFKIHKDTQPDVL